MVEKKIYALSSVITFFQLQQSHLMIVSDQFLVLKMPV